MRRLNGQRLVLILMAFLALSACKKLDKAEKSKAAIAKLVADKTPLLTTLEATIGKLLEKAEMVASDAPGLPAIKKKLTMHQSLLQGLHADLAKLPSQSEGKKLAELDEMLKQMNSRLAGLEQVQQDVVASTNELDKLLASHPKPATVTQPAATLSFSRELSTGVKIAGADTGIETKLLAFIEDDSKAADKDTWFEFDRVTFTTGSAEIDESKSNQQLGNIAEILRAFPKVEIKIGGYTDNTGSDEVNKSLSQKRADAVKAAVIELGRCPEGMSNCLMVDAKRVTSEGYGKAHPVCPANDTPECRAKNRRIAVRVSKK